MTTQKIEIILSKEQIAYSYYQVLNIVNNLGLSKKDLQVLVFTAVRGSITNPAAKQDFCIKYKSSIGTIYNSISKLTRKGVLVKTGTKISIVPQILLDFNNDIILNICLRKNHKI